VREHCLDHSLTRMEWQLARVVEPSGTWSPPPEVDTVLRFDGEGHFSAKACNHYGGPVRIEGDLLHVGRVNGTQMLCCGVKRDVQEAFLGVMDGEVRWAISDDELCLDKPDGRGLRFRVRDTIYPSRDLRPFLQGRRNGGDYRFGWRTGSRLISLQWEWRDAPGKPWGFAGMTYLSAGPVPGPDPLIAPAGSERFVFGVVAAATVRVIYQPPHRQTATQLALFTVPVTSTWQAFGGLITQAREGAVVVALDGRGHELGRSHRLPS
jgi:heat shock protein HslJ